MEKDLGVDKALNYKSPTFRKEFIDSVGYLDVYFDNIGGDILNLALSRLKKNARIALCGTPLVIVRDATMLKPNFVGAIADYSPCFAAPDGNLY